MEQRRGIVRLSGHGKGILEDDFSVKGSGSIRYSVVPVRYLQHHSVRLLSDAGPPPQRCCLHVRERAGERARISATPTYSTNIIIHK
jgi:hypothetical protein